MAKKKAPKKAAKKTRTDTSQMGGPTAAALGKKDRDQATVAQIAAKQSSKVPPKGDDKPPFFSGMGMK